MPEEISPRFFWTEEDIKALPTLPEPVETFDISTDETIKIRIIRWQLFKHLIHPQVPGAPIEKLTLALRIWLAPGYGTPRAPYFDIHQGHLISLLMPFLQREDYKDYEVIITKRGSPPKAYFEVEFKKVV
jgi:hypothetical protein